MRKPRIAINGFGRIGRTLSRILLNQNNVELVAVNDLADIYTLANLFKYDSVHGIYKGEIVVKDNILNVAGQSISFYQKNNPADLPWKDHEIDIVVESTGKFADGKGGQLHIAAGAHRVILSAPSKDKDGVKTIVLGVNDSDLKASDVIISNASCTTNNAAPMLKVLDDGWGIESAFVTTVHSYTSDQNLHDAPHKDLRRARAAAMSIIPTTTGAAKTLTDVLPHLTGKIGGAGIRVPVPNGSLTDITCILQKQTTIEEINHAFLNASQRNLKGILGYTTDPIVSVDIIDNPYSCLFDSQLTTVLGKMVKVLGWYDNESGFSHRLADLIQKVSSLR